MPKPRRIENSSVINIAGLSELDLAALRRLWTQQLGSVPLARISRELLVRAVAHRVQEQREGGLSGNDHRRLDRLAGELETLGQISSVAPAFAAKAGTRLVREWQGKLHEVVILERGYLWKGHTYRSLSEIARLITGARWSGPRFFGLLDKNRPGDVTPRKRS
jgi:hypothetical protein